MRHYELMVIIDSGLEDDVIQSIVERTTKEITGAGGTVSKVDRWGKRRLAYEVHHRSEGYYVLIDMRAEPVAVAAVDRMLGLADEVVRHKVIRLPDREIVTVSRRSAPESAPVEANANGET